MQKIKGKGKGLLQDEVYGWCSQHPMLMAIAGMLEQVREGLDSVWVPETAPRAVTVRKSWLFSL